MTCEFSWNFLFSIKFLSVCLSVCHTHSDNALINKSEKKVLPSEGLFQLVSRKGVKIIIH